MTTRQHPWRFTKISRTGIEIMPAAALFLTFLMLLACPSCISWSTADGTKHTLVLGFGMISQKEAPDHSATALRAKTLGLAIRTGALNRGLALGYQNFQQTAIGPDWQGVVKVTSSPGEPLTMTALGDGSPSPGQTFPAKEENTRCLPESVKDLTSLP